MNFNKLEMIGMYQSDDVPDIFTIHQLTDLWENGVVLTKYNKRFKDWYKQSGISTPLKIYLEKTIDWEKFFNINSNIKNTHSLLDFNVDIKKEFDFIQMENNETEQTILFGHDEIPFIYKECVLMNYKEIGFVEQQFEDLIGYEKLKAIAPDEYNECTMFLYNKSEMEDVKNYAKNSIYEKMLDKVNSNHVFFITW